MRICSSVALRLRDDDSLTDGAAIPAGTTGWTVQDAAGNAVALGGIAAATTAAQRTTQVVDAINAKSSETGVFAREASGGGYEVFSNRDLTGATAFGAAFTATTTGDPGDTAPPATLATLSGINVNSFGDAQLSLKVIDSAINMIATQTNINPVRQCLTKACPLIKRYQTKDEPIHCSLLMLNCGSIK